MTRCCGCGQGEESCLCDDNPFPMYMRGDGWSERKILFDQQRRNANRDNDCRRSLVSENENLRKENEKLKAQLSEISKKSI